jgi:ribosomal protein S18 acetylase RimI-like enzyme
MAHLVEATHAHALAEIRALFAEYALGVDEPACFAGFERELASLPGDYAPPRGRLLLALDNNQPAGCVALRPLDATTGEMKRLYVRPAHRGSGLGRDLVQAAIVQACAAGYARLLLDSLPKMHAAIALYRGFGFTEIEPYLAEPTPGARCFALKLPARAGGVGAR